VSHAMFAKRKSSPAAMAKGSFSGLRIGEPNDAFEQEADRVADEIMAGGTLPRWSIAKMSVNPPLQRKCSCGGSGGSGTECEECKPTEAPTLLRKAPSATESGFAPPIVHEVLKSPGQPLDKDTRRFFEPRFGHDFSKVRVHTDWRAAESAQAVGALAYTVGHRIVFGRGEFAPNDLAGRQLLAHELAHVANHRTNEVPSHTPLSVVAPDDPHEVAVRQITEANLSQPLLRSSASTGTQAKLFRQIIRENPFGPGTNSLPPVTHPQSRTPATGIIRENPFIASTTVPDLNESIVRRVSSAIAQGRFQEAINILVEELARGTLGPVMINTALLQNGTMSFDLSLPQEGNTDEPKLDRNGDVFPAKVTIGPPAFQKGVPWLYSTILHEYVHVLQAQTTSAGRNNPRLGQIQVTGTDPRGHGQEVEAYAQEILNTSRTGLKAKPALVEELWRRLRNEHWIKLMPIMKRSLTGLVNRAFAVASSIVGPGKLIPP
jgi:hypothetical protein